MQSENEGADDAKHGVERKELKKTEGEARARVNGRHALLQPTMMPAPEGPRTL